MRKDNLLPGLAVAGGVLGFLVRKWQLSSAYAVETQLFLPHAPATLVLLGLMVVLAAAFLVLIRGGKRLEDYLPAFGYPFPSHMTMMAASGFLFFGAGLLGLMDGMEQLTMWRMYPGSVMLTYPLSLLLCAVLCFPSGLAMLLLGKASYRGDLSPSASLLASLPAFAGMVWLFSTHLAHGVDPSLMRYGFLLGAAILLTLSHYFMAGFLFEHVHSGCMLFCSLMGVVMGLTALADRPSLFATFTIAAFSLSALACARALLRNSFGPPWPKRLLDDRLSRKDEEEDSSQNDEE